MALASSLNPAFGPTLGLIGIALFMVVQVLTIHSYSKKLTDLKVSGKGVSPGSNIGCGLEGGDSLKEGHGIA